LLSALPQPSLRSLPQLPLLSALKRRGGGGRTTAKKGHLSYGDEECLDEEQIDDYGDLGSF